MLKHSYFLIIIGLGFFLNSCTMDSGNTKLTKIKTEEINTNFIKGKTTQEEIRKAFGDPDDTDILNDGSVKWIYTHIKRTSMAR